MTMMTYYSDKISIVADGYSATGLSHIRDGRPNQDSFLIRLKPHLKVFAVADGLGSHAHSAQGSQSVTKAVFKAFKKLSRGKIVEEKVPERIFKHYVGGVRKKWRAEAGTTCLFAAITNNKLYLGQAGDGVCSVSIDGKFKATRQRDTDFMNEVYALSANRTYSGWRFRSIPLEGIKDVEIVLMTDGISEDVLPDKLKEFSSYVVGKIVQGEEGELKKIIDGWSVPGSVDDKTMVAVRWKYDD